MTFTLHRLRFETEVTKEIVLGPHQGAGIRGALFNALRGYPGRPGFCAQPMRRECRHCPELLGCPVSLLFATVDVTGRRGADIPRPYTIEPPLAMQTQYAVGQEFNFGVTVFGEGISLFPYLVVAVRRMEEEGIGRRSQDRAGRWSAGRFRILRVFAENPISGVQQLVTDSGSDIVRIPAAPVTSRDIMWRADMIGSPKVLALDFRTPTRLVVGGRPERTPAFAALMQRLLERLSSLWSAYAGVELVVDFEQVMKEATAVRLVGDETRWVELRGWSHRQDAAKVLDGFVGRAVYEGSFDNAMPLLLWGEQTHVGKDAVKGCGVYQVSVFHKDSEEPSITGDRHATAGS